MVNNITQSFLDYLSHEKKYSDYTVLAYKGDLLQFEHFLDTEYGISDLYSVSSVQIRTWLADLSLAGLEGSSISRKLSTLKRFYKFLLINKELDKNPTELISSPKKKSKLPSFIPESKVESLYQNSTLEEFEENRDILILQLFLETGIRLSELINIKVNHINLDAQEIKVLGKRKKFRLVPFSFQLKGQIIELTSKNPDVRCEYLFQTSKGKKVYPSLVYRMVNAKLSNLTTQNKKSPHVLRHTFATNMLNNGAELNSIKELLGHSSLSATQIYAHNSFEKLKSIYKTAHPKA